MQKNNKSILIIEDEEDILEGLENLLKKRITQNINRATDYSSAITALNSKMPDLIILDLRLPDSDGIINDDTGFEIIRYILREKKEIKPKILILSVRNDPDSEKKFIELKKNGKNILIEKMVKSISLRELLTTIDRLRR